MNAFLKQSLLKNNNILTFYKASIQALKANKLPSGTNMKGKKNKKNESTLLKSSLRFNTSSFPTLEVIIVLFYIINVLLLLAIYKLVVLTDTLKLVKTIEVPVLAQPFPLYQQSTMPNVSAKAYLIYDQDSRVVVSSQNETLRFSPASAAKIMTALVAIEYYNLEQVFDTTGSSEIIGSKMGIYYNEKLRAIDLLYGLMLPSGNDAAYVLAHNYPGGEASFVNAMNIKAEFYKLVDTHFTDASGYDDENYTTARDLARLTSFALENKAFSEIVKTKSILIQDTNGVYKHNLTNLNKLLDMPGVLGVKTGYTDEAKGVLVTAYEYKGKSFIIVILKSEDRFEDTKELLSNVIQRIQFISY